jgi:hypothetical protein
VPGLGSDRSENFRAEPHRSIGVLQQAFRPGALTISEHWRGVMP